jgi:uncharacterized protein with HEPN domain
MKHRDSRVLEKILDEIEFLETATNGVTYEQFIDDEEKKRAVAMTLINIGETVRLLSDEFRDANPHIPYREITATRNVAAHGYQTLNHLQG